MDLSTWLEAENGRSASLALHFNVSRAAVSQWKRNGVPVSNMKAVRDFTQGMVTLEEMVPDLTPNPRTSTESAPAPEPAAAEAAKEGA